MFLLPKGNPLYEKVAAAKINLPEILGKLKAGSFTGYLSFSFLPPKLSSSLKVAN